MNYPDIGIHVRKDKLNGMDYPRLLCLNVKNLETRNTPTLNKIAERLHGKRVGIIDTSVSGKAMLIGEVTMGSGCDISTCVYTKECWDKYFNDPLLGKHLVMDYSEFAWNENTRYKYLYPVSNGILYDKPVEVTWLPERGDNRTWRYIEVKGTK